MTSLTKVWLLLFVCYACNSPKSEKDNAQKENVERKHVVSQDCELFIPGAKVNGVLILFGGYPETAKDIQREFEIVEVAARKNVAVILSNLNQRLWLATHEKDAICQSLSKAIDSNQLPKDNIYIGGFSSGGVIGLLVSNYLLGMEKNPFVPKGVFAVDSPVDLEALYYTAQENIRKNFSEISVREGAWLLDLLNDNIGSPQENSDNYERESVFLYSTNHTGNLMHLKETKVRFYTEPDTLWWKENRLVEYKFTNAFYLEKLYERLEKQGYKDVDLIQTHNRGYRANGDRHPHSWSIVDKDELLDWMLVK